MTLWALKKNITGQDISLGQLCYFPTENCKLSRNQHAYDRDKCMPLFDQLIDLMNWHGSLLKPKMFQVTNTQSSNCQFGDCNEVTLSFILVYTLSHDKCTCLPICAHTNPVQRSKLSSTITRQIVLGLCVDLIVMKVRCLSWYQVALNNTAQKCHYPLGNHPASHS